jgi:hypothetical protein
VSGYLMRLATRRHEAREAQSIQPFVRSASPIAERDQRIGMMGFEESGLGQASLAEGGSEAGAEQGDVLQPPVPRRIIIAGETERAAIQRKRAGPLSGIAGFATFTTPGGTTTAANAQTQARVQSLTNDVGAPHLAEGIVPLLPGPPMVVLEKDVVADAEWSGSSTEPLSLANSQTVSVPHQFDPYAVHTRSLRQQQVDPTRLEPSSDALVEDFKPLLERASEPGASINEGPRVVIGRINVEVVAPPAVPPSAAATRPGPLTAASVSVIGPLTGSSRPSLRLSLRHR